MKNCIECGKEIVGRRKHAKRCLACSEVRNKSKRREGRSRRWRERPKRLWKCVDCGDDADERSKRCPACKKARNSITRKEASKRWQLRNPEKVAAQNRAPSKKVYNDGYRDRNRAKCNERVATWAENNRERRKATQKIYYENNKDEIKRKYQIWTIDNRDKNCARAARRRAAKMQATPSWADIDKIGFIYAEAQRISRETGIVHHVDHIYPLRSKFMCGLHVETNLQILPAKENLSKSNHRWPSQPCDKL